MKEARGENVKPMLRDARRIFVPVFSRDDSHYVQITKVEATRLLDASGFAVRADGTDLYIEAADR